MIQTEVQYKDLKRYCNANLDDGYYATFKHLFKQSKKLNCRYFLVFNSYRKYIAILYSCNLDNIVNMTNGKILGLWFMLRQLGDIEASIAIKINDKIYNTAYFDIFTIGEPLELILDSSQKTYTNCVYCWNNVKEVILYPKFYYANNGKRYSNKTKYMCICDKCKKQEYKDDIGEKIYTKFDIIL